MHQSDEDEPSHEEWESSGPDISDSGRGGDKYPNNIGANCSAIIEEKPSHQEKTNSVKNTS